MHFFSWKDWDCRGGYLLKYSSLMFTLLYWIRHGNSTRWQGDETGLTSQLISTLSLPTQPKKGCTTPPRCTPLLFTNSSVGSLTSHKNQSIESAVKGGLATSCSKKQLNIPRRCPLKASFNCRYNLYTVVGDTIIFITRGSNYQQIFISNSWFRSGRRSKVGWNKVRCCEGKNIFF